MRNLTFLYEANSYGVFIQDIYGNLYTNEDWDGTKIANGVAVISEKCSFVIDKKTSPLRFGRYGASAEMQLLPGVVSSSEQSVAFNDFKGKGNTATMVSYYNSNTVANTINAIISANGQRGYIGSAGEWKVAVDNKDAIDAAMNIIGGELQSDGTGGSLYWKAYITSTQYNSVACWGVSWENGDITPFSKEDLLMAIPFCTFTTPDDIISFTISGTTYNAVRGTTWTDWCRSSFNTDGYENTNGRIEAANGYTVTTVPYDSGEVGVNDEIIEGATYYLI